MFHVSKGGTGIQITSSHVTTIKKNESVSSSSDQPQFMNKRILTFPIPQRTTSSSALANNIIQTKRKYELQLQAREAFEDVANFEKRIYGKKLKLPPPIDIKPPTSEQLSLLRTFEPPSPTKFFDVYKNPSEDSSTSQNEQRIRSELASLPYSQKNALYERKTKNDNETDTKKNTQKTRPAVWTLLDEPIIPSRPNIEYKSERLHKKPFYSMSKNYNKQGIPTLVSDLDAYNKRQNEKFEESVRAQNTSDIINYEKQIQIRVQNNIQKTREKHEKTSKLIVKSGQDWPQKMITQQLIKQNQKKQPKPKPLSKEDLEALEFLEKRDDQIWIEMKEKEKKNKIEKQQIEFQQKQKKICQKSEEAE